MANRKILTNGNTFRRSDNRWGGVVWYRDEQGERKRKSFSGTTKQEVNRKMTDYIANFEKEVNENTIIQLVVYDIKQGLFNSIGCGPGLKPRKAFKLQPSRTSRNNSHYTFFSSEKILPMAATFTMVPV